MQIHPIENGLCQKQKKNGIVVWAAHEWVWGVDLASESPRL